MTFFRSRWVEPPEEIEELAPASLAEGFEAAGVACGLKGAGRTDVAVMRAAEGSRSALLLTRNAAAAAPVRVCRERCDAAAISAAVVNSGNANAETGAGGYAAALSMRDETASALGVPPEQVAVAETGTIGVPLPLDLVLGGIAEATGRLSPGGGEEFATAIMTTDRWPKLCSLRTQGVTLSAQAKGGGMIEPGFATLLCFVQTDALIPDPDGVLREAVSASFERITVDGQMSTNDTVLLQSTGASGKPLPQGLLDAVLVQLAIEVVSDGEGATRVGRIEVRNAASEAEAERVARAIANSPLVKTALFGSDPNWGRIAQAAGMALAGEELEEIGADAIQADELAGKAAEVDVAIDLGRGTSGAQVWFSDLGYEYVKINAEYTT